MRAAAWTAIPAFLIALFAGTAPSAEAANPLYVLLARQITVNPIRELATEETHELKARDGSGTFNVDREPALEAKDLESATVTERHGKNPLVSITLTPEAAARMKKVGNQQLGKRIALVLVGQLMKAPHLTEPFKGQGIQFEVSSLKDAQLIAELINAL